MAKVCKSCLAEKNESDFYFRKELNKLNNRCKACCVSNTKHVKDLENKVCKHCHELKSNSEYQKAGGGKWLQPYCKLCDSIRKRKFYEKDIDGNKLKRNLEYKKWREANPIQPKPQKPRKKDDKDHIRKIRLAYTSTPEFKAKKSQRDRLYREQNREKVIAQKREHYKLKGLQQAKDWQKKMMNDPGYRVKKNLRGRIYVALRRGVKSASTMKLLGCTIDEFVKHFEDLFENGMSWDYYMKGKIHIDHIRPCATFDLTKEEDQKICFHYKNLQPLWKLDNLKKGKKWL